MKFNQALYVLLFALGITLLYEGVSSYIPILKNFKSSHFWTAYNDNSNSLLTINTDTTLTDIDSSLSVVTDHLNGQDSLLELGEFVIVGKDTLYIKDFDNYDGVEHLSDFFQKLRELRAGKRKRVRIAYFGDSTTEGDIIVGDLRDSLQKMFGGRGVGYVSIAPHGTALRKTLRHIYSKNWHLVNYFNKNIDFKFGISGDYSTAKATSMDKSHTVTFRPAWGNYPSMNYFNKIYLFYGQPQKTLKQYPTLFSTINGRDSSQYELVPTTSVNKISLTEKWANQVDLAFNFPSPFPIFGLSFESETGILVDNFAKRSDSGAHLGRINANVMRQFYTHLGCDLVILHYGANVLHKTKDYSYYERTLMAGIRNFQRNMQNVPVLIIGSTDRVDKINGKEQTNPIIHHLIESQKKAAVKTNTSFFDLFQAMGGAGTMLDWAKQRPPLVASDHVHFNHRGGKVIAYKLLDFLLDTYLAQTGDNIRVGDPNTFIGKAFQEAQIYNLR